MDEREWKDSSGGYVIIAQQEAGTYILVWSIHGEESAAVNIEGAEAAREMSAYLAQIADKIDKIATR